MKIKSGYLSAAGAVRRSISHNERAVLVMDSGVGPSERTMSAVKELAAYGYEDSAAEAPGLIDAWGTHEGQEWRVLLVDDLQHGIERYLR